VAAARVKFLKVLAIVALMGGLYAAALHMHAERDRLRNAEAELTPACRDKLESYGLTAGAEYRSPYLQRVSGVVRTAHGYSEQDIRAIQRGCNIIDDLQGYQAQNGPRERWYANRYVRGTYTTCVHCHQGVGDKQDAQGNRLPGSNHLGASWV